MADFKTHITASTILGAAYGATGYYVMGVPLPSCLLAGGLCSLSGMLPDLDSDSGIPLRETVGFASAVIPILMLERFVELELSHEEMVLAASLIYLLIRFVIAEIFRRYTVHRGMWHSVPAAISCGLVAYMICSCHDTGLRLFKAFAVTLGFLSHLVLDELWSLEWKRGRWRIKKSAGTALKLWGKSAWGNVSTYGKLVLLVFFAFFADEQIMSRLRRHESNLHRTAGRVWEHLVEPGTTTRR